MTKDRFGTDGDGEPAFPRVSLRDAKRRPYNPPPSHLEATVTRIGPKGSVVRRPTNYVAPAKPGRGVTLEQWNALRRYAAAAREDDR